MDQELARSAEWHCVT